ncbi:MAG: ribosomal RNA small subunit methyltransferase A [Chitinophagales bacterium]|nr:MAG: ribosomal RNA small subunit methyltransferase A [Chitinophagales bacterium]
MNGQNYIKPKDSALHPRPKKRLGQHFLTDHRLAKKIVAELKEASSDYIVEIGPGRGILTGMLLKQFGDRFHAVEIDSDLARMLKQSMPTLHVLTADFLKLNLSETFPGTIAIIGNFPYNISSQILFRVVACHTQVQTVVGMFQREVAKRVVANPGNREYGIISVLLSAWYKREYLFELKPGAFSPPPKVHSAVIKLTHHENTEAAWDEQMLATVVKTAFNQRRKMLRNSLQQLLSPEELEDSLFRQRPEQLSLQQFIQIADMINQRKV